MASHLSNPWNYAVAYVETLRGSTPIGSGTAFFWVHKDRTILCTNWHVLSGVNPLNNKISGIPDTVRVFGYRPMSKPDPRGFVEYSYSAFGVALCQDAQGGERWREHPVLGRRVDIAVIDITDDIAGFDVRHVNELEDDAVLDPFCSQDVFVLGFPFGQITGAPAPVWKRGTIALDPFFDPEGLPKLLIDTATRECMSGSPVLARHIILGSDHEKKDGSRSEVFLYCQRTVVLGIYSGPHYPDLDKAQIGIVWKRKALEETISAGRCPEL